MLRLFFHVGSSIKKKKSKKHNTPTPTSPETAASGRRGPEGFGGLRPRGEPCAVRGDRGNSVMDPAPGDGQGAGLGAYVAFS